MLHRYVHYLRVAYLTQQEKNEGFPVGWAGRTIFACVCAHVVTPALLLIAITGGIRGLGRNATLAFFLVPLAAVLWWETKYIEGSDALRSIWTELSSQSPDEKVRRWRSVSWLIGGSIVALFVSMGAVFARAILEHRASVGAG
jgi:hypothetical protein